MLKFCKYTFAYIIDKPALIGVICATRVKTIISRIRKGTDIEERMVRAISFPSVCGN